MDEIRKIQLTGRNTYIVSLPHDWVQKIGIAKGDQIYINENADGCILLSPKQQKKEPKEYVIEVDADRSIAMRNIVSAYISGAGKIILKGRGINTVAEHARLLLSGVEIVDETEEEIVLKVLTFEELDVDSVIKRAFNVTKSMFVFASEVCKNGKGEFVEISKKEEDVDRLYILLLRDLVMGSLPQKDAMFKAIIAKSIEKIGDHLVDLCDNAKDAGRNEWLAELVNRAGDVYAQAMESFLSKNHNNVKYNGAKTMYLKAYEKMDKEIEGTKNMAKRLILLILLEKCNKIVRYSDDIMEFNNDMAFISNGSEKKHGHDTREALSTSRA
jgi:phosphate uptake regulator